MGRTRSSEPPQVRLPGQADAATGPINLNRMYLVHHEIRGDLDRSSAVEETPLKEAVVWEALAGRWARFEDLARFHVRSEDETFWRPVPERAVASRDNAASSTLTDMEQEHQAIIGQLGICTAYLSAMARSPDARVRDRLDASLGSLRTSVSRHLEHNEVAAGDAAGSSLLARAELGRGRTAQAVRHT